MSKIERDLESEILDILFWRFFDAHVQTVSGGPQAFKPVSIGALFTGVKRPESDGDNSSPSRTDVKNVWG
jgi:hypothetical protein